MTRSQESQIGTTDKRIAVEAVACILRRLVDDGLITADAARTTMADSIPTLTDSVIQALWVEASETFVCRPAEREPTEAGKTESLPPAILLESRDETRSCAAGVRLAFGMGDRDRLQRGRVCGA